MTAPEKILLPTRRLDPDQAALLRDLKPGDVIEITQQMRVGKRQWQAVVTGTFRELLYLETGITTERIKEDDLVVPILRFRKANGELSSIAIDERTRVKRLNSPASPSPAWLTAPPRPS